jgi:hypothetical protein
MTTFSVAPQSVAVPGWYRLEFSVDPADYAKCIVRVFAAGAPDKPPEHPNDHMEAVFARNGMLVGSRMVDAEVEAEAAERAAAERRLASVPATAVSDEDRKAQEAEKAKQLEADKALLAAEPKVSKYEVPASEPKPEPEPAPETMFPPAPAPLSPKTGAPA